MTTITVKQQDGKVIEDITWEPQELEITERPNGPGVAAILAAGIGVAALGILTTLSEASTSVKDFLNFQNRVGPLSGKTTIAGIVWLFAWALLAPPLWNRNVRFGPVAAVTAALIVIGAVGTFPKFFELFAD